LHNPEVGLRVVDVITLAWEAVEEGLRLPDDGGLLGLLAGISQREPARDDGGLAAGEGEFSAGNEGGGDELLGAEVDPVLQEVVVLSVEGEHVGGEGEIGELAVVEWPTGGGWGAVIIVVVVTSGPCGGASLCGRPHDNVAGLPWQLRPGGRGGPGWGEAIVGVDHM
jgi:hypothetical protein